MSDDPTEEKLHWEPSDEMEFDDDFLLPNNKSSAIAAAVAADKKKAKNKITVRILQQYTNMNVLPNVFDTKPDCVDVRVLPWPSKLEDTQLLISRVEIRGSCKLI